MTSVVRALDEIGAVVEHIELSQPTLDDVFAEATGRRLEGAEVGDGAEPAPADGSPDTAAAVAHENGVA